MCGALNEVGSFSALSTGPTRGSSTIDLIYSNVPSAHNGTLVLPPLQADGGAPSDHRCIYTEVELPKERGYTWEVQLRRTRDAAREQAFVEDMIAQDWGPLLGSADVDKMVSELQRVVGSLPRSISRLPEPENDLRSLLG